MGFTTGFTSGVTLTLGLAYLTVLAHERNRSSQAQSLRSQSRVLEGLLQPTPLPPPQSRAELAREERSTLTEAAKDRWNAEVENAVRWVQRTDWDEAREGIVGSVSRLLGGGIQKSRDEIEHLEKVSAHKVQEAIDQSKSAAKHAKDQAAEYRDTAAAKAVRATDEAKSGAIAVSDSIRRSGGTVDAARGAVRDALSKGVEKGKEAIDRAQAAIGLAEEKIESKAQSSAISHSSAVEKALHERYEKPNGLDKSVEETLEERYKPVESEDPTKLRGLFLKRYQAQITTAASATLGL
ncbi:MICOS complex subunit MIC12 [Venustampulla echinocandica]|uniref:MICOS complex subunit MIC12 n=1 Tax=Venustampulla echinocandica TaxID=2656787 RepID=A0A370TQR2_9HELO|nr:MICOS complex subunit MIC12 [Venustampulla echinocandica]RDL37876.1 MICOS complex subunit MIC12 [Venustampulla echinocandica]